MPLRVVHVTPYYAPAYAYGGPPRSIETLCRGLVAAGAEVDLITTTANGAGDLEPGAHEERGVRVQRFARRWPRRFFGARLTAPLATALQRADICHVHGIWNVPEWIATREARVRRIPYVLSPRGMLLSGALAHHAWRKHLLFGLVERSAIDAAARLHVTSAAEADEVAALADPARIRIIPNGIDMPPADVSVEDVRGAAGVGRDDPVVLVLGRIHPIKRLDLVAAAVASLRREYPRLTLVMAGRDETGTLRRLAPVLEPLEGSVRILGHLDDGPKWAWLRAASALVCCSDSENFGMSVAEAMAAGVPVVVTRTCPWPDVARIGAGYWVDQTVPAIAEALGAVLADAPRARAMGDRGRALVEQSYSWRAAGRAMLEVYDEVVRERANAAA